MVTCPKCKTGDYLKKVSEIYMHYQHKDAVKKFFGDEICAVPDCLEDPDLEILGKSGEYELSPPPEPKLIRFPIAIMTLIFIGSVLIATFVGMHLIGLVYVIEKPGDFILILGLFLVSVSFSIFTSVSFRNRKALQQYDAALERWKQMIICSQCRSILSV